MDPLVYLFNTLLLKPPSLNTGTDVEMFIFHCNSIEFYEIKPFQPSCSAFLYIPQPHTMRLHLLYQPILHVNVCIEGLVVINYFTTFDQKTIALQQKEAQHKTRNYSLGDLTGCSVTPEMKEEWGGKGKNLCIIHQHTSKHQSTAVLSTGKIKMLYFHPRGLSSLMIRKK